MRTVILFLVAVLFSISCSSYKGKLERYTGNGINEDAMFDEGVTELSKGLAKAMVKRELFNVAVIQFINSDNSTSSFGRAISEKVAGKLAQFPDNFAVIERKHLSRAEFIEQQQLRRIDGSIRTIISGTYQELDHSIDISACLVDIHTGQVWAATNILIKKSSSLMWALTSDQYINRINGVK